MSAYIVEDETINNIVSMIISDEDGSWVKSKIKRQTGHDMDTEEGTKAFATDLRNLNVAGVSARYGGTVITTTLALGLWVFVTFLMVAEAVR